MIVLKTKSQIETMNRCNEIVLSILEEISRMIRPGVAVVELDSYAEKRTREEGARPAFKGYQDFPSTLCVSINEQVVHGIPGPRKLKPGDVVSVDFGVVLDGLYGDGAETFPVGDIDPSVHKLVQVTRECLRRGIEQMQPGRHTGDVGHAIQSYAESQRCGVVKDFVGHGVGEKLHEDPQVPNYGRAGHGTRMEVGMVLAIEPMINMGGPEVEIGEDEWTVTTVDRLPSAHFERSVAVTEDGPWILGSGARPGVLSLALPMGQGRTSMEKTAVTSEKVAG
ncbi:MAG: type I methionyl aminopeptidase [Fidelibacterota bacterium]